MTTSSQPTRNFTPIDALTRALNKAADDVRAVLDKDDGEQGVDRQALRNAENLIHVLRRVVAPMDANEVHRAFGAPGDYGYETRIGDALARVYGVRK